MKEKLLFDDWGPVPESSTSPWEWLRTVGEALLVAACFALGMLALLLGAVLYIAVLAVLLCIYPFLATYELGRKAAGEGPTVVPDHSWGETILR